ncbi:hypothetical protein [Streptomyces sp. ISL-86]|uniref:DUF7224 domain-containing protein n=1 Tax=Streptomyces sp. ISL-86 TaxID=2819187 RepID=UPI001BE8774F|nr:hypothetical protein [Streptomyces sp. ISL-86]MBT2455728.1 hypothetical protein [Streptomyces sp. ISL-86]
MLLRTLLRSSAAVYVIPLLILFIMTAIGRDLTAWTTAGYWPSATGSSLHSLPFISTISAGLAAWEGARLTQGKVFGQTAARSPLAITTPVLAPVVLGGLLTSLTALLLSANAAGVGAGLPDLAMLLTVALMITMNTLLGFCAGMRWRAVISVPVALVGAFFLNAYPVSWSIVWLRHLIGGGMADCCAVDQVLDTRALWPVALFAGGLILACLIGITYRTSSRTIAAMTGSVIIGVGLAVATAIPIPVTPVADRPTGELVCEKASDTTVCLWPEVSSTDKIRPSVAAVRQKLADAGIETSDRFTMAATPKQGEAKLGIGTKPRGADVVAGVALSLMPALPACAQNGPYPAAPAQPPTAAWLLLTAGMPAEALSGRFDPATVELANRIRTLPREEQNAWYQFNNQAMQGCSTTPQIVPAGLSR